MLVRGGGFFENSSLLLDVVRVVSSVEAKYVKRPFKANCEVEIAIAVLIVFEGWIQPQCFSKKMESALYLSARFWPSGYVQWMRFMSSSLLKTLPEIDQ